MHKDRFAQAIPINPSFPNWNKSFISGHGSVLFNVEHRIAQNPLELISHVRFKETAEGPPGYVHGGATAALIDEVMGILVWHENIPSVTQKLELKYLRPLPLNQEAHLVTTIEETSEKTTTVKTIVYGNKKTPCVEANGVFHRITEDWKKKFLIP